MGGIHALLPVKALADAKTRLSERYTDEQRRCLVLAMLADTLSAAVAVEAVGHVSVVTSDAEVAVVARAAGADVIAEPETTRSLNDALTFALHHVYIADALILQADLPALTTAELAAFVTSEATGHTFVADHHGSGTTALLLRRSAPPFAPRFGIDSAVRHRQAGAVPAVGAWPGLRHDVDTPTDLDAAVELGVGHATFEALASSAMCVRRS